MSHFWLLHTDQDYRVWRRPGQWGSLYGIEEQRKVMGEFRWQLGEDIASNSIW